MRCGWQLERIWVAVGRQCQRTGSAGGLESGELFLVENHIERGDAEAETERKRQEERSRRRCGGKNRSRGLASSDDLQNEPRRQRAATMAGPLSATLERETDWVDSERRGAARNSRELPLLRAAPDWVAAAASSAAAPCAALRALCSNSDPALFAWARFSARRPRTAAEVKVAGRLDVEIGQKLETQGLGFTSRRIRAPRSGDGELWQLGAGPSSEREREKGACVRCGLQVAVRNLEIRMPIFSSSLHHPLLHPRYLASSTLAHHALSFGSARQSNSRPSTFRIVTSRLRPSILGRLS
ncbi:hypothetical protein L1887_55524 [Cichorium endivia]|nr:hypothetical protein L1887_55524 [Cichorium endivia]